MSLPNRKESSPLKLSKNIYLTRVLHNSYFIHASPYFLCWNFFSSVTQVPKFILFSSLYSSAWRLKCEFWCWPTLIHWCILVLKKRDMYFHFFKLSLSRWLKVWNDAWLLSKGWKQKEIWCSLHFTFAFLEDLVIPTIRLVGPFRKQTFASY